ncbi:hypothetical protein CYMTET_13661 [Cymbomonas tetramitiformis]|uniref:Uncharacterized protein n=1 Tax=Cymbomonas tetramitiformis TaxID=36881 RepID=A0AAE0GHY7_9CHLO|nr:hypothetical protein CYMTET_13661 [Cymbomonas tetramitiformis]
MLTDTPRKLPRRRRPPLGSAACFKTIAPNQKVLSDALYYTCQLHRGTEPACSWLVWTNEDYLLSCNDGSECHALEDPDGWSCCEHRGQRAKCPLNYPEITGALSSRCLLRVRGRIVPLPSTSLVATVLSTAATSSPQAASPSIGTSR